MVHFTKTHKHNNKCYRHHLLQFDSGLFDDCVDMAYVLTMENSKNHDSFMQQLEIHKPHSKVIVQYNKGYKNCNKNIGKQITKDDLIDAYRNVFEHALHHNYRHVLVFEEDFFMDDYNEEDIDNINNFVSKNKFSVYNLGPLMCHSGLDIFNDTKSNHYKCELSTTAHAVIYNKHYMKDFIKAADKQKIEDQCDTFWNDSKYKVYTYYKPIAFQLFPETENSNNWGGSAFMRIFNRQIYKILQLDKSHRHFRLHRDATRYGLAGFLFFILFLVLIISLVFMYKSC